MDFDLSEDQLALRDGGPRAARRPVLAPARVRAVARRRPTAGTATSGRDGRAGLARRRGAGGRGRPRARVGRARRAARGDRPPRRAGSVPPDGAGDRGRSAGPATAELRRAARRRRRAARASRGAAAPTRCAPTADGARGCSPVGRTRCRSRRRRRRARRRARRRRARGVRRRPRRGRSPGAEPAMDLTRPLGWLQFDAHAGDAGSAAPSSSTRCSTAARPRPRSSCSARATRALDMAVEYAKERVQFGRPIGSFQAVKHRCADMLVDVEGMRSSVVLGGVVPRRRRSRPRRSPRRPRRPGRATRRSG